MQRSARRPRRSVATAPALRFHSQGLAAVGSPPRRAPRRRSRTIIICSRSQVFAALVEAIDVSQLAKMDVIQARDSIGEIVTDIVTAKKVVMSISEQDDLLRDICNDVLGYGPLEPLLARDDIADIMVNGANTVYH